MKTLLLLALAALAIAACAPFNEAGRDAREYERIEFKEQFIADRKACFSRGRTIHVDAYLTSLDRNGIPESRVRYFCA